VSTAQLGDLSTTLIYGAMAAYAVAFVAFAIDLSALRDRGPQGRRRRAAAVAMNVTWLGAGLQAAGVVLRGLAAGRVPWANMYEFTIVFSLVAVLVFLGVSLRRDVRYLGALVTGPALLALGLAVSVLYVAAEGVQPALQSYWLVIHVSVATISAGVFSVAAGFSVLQLVRAGSQERAAGRTAEAVAPASGTTAAAAAPATEATAATSSGGGATAGAPGVGTVATVDPPPTGSAGANGGSGSAPDAEGRGGALSRVVRALPPSAELERLAYRLNAVGFVLWTFTLIAGAIWAEHAWGRYWGWDAKEVWTFVIWVIYAAYLHARSTRGWSGRRAAYFALFGYVCILLNFFVVNLAFTSKHTYSGIG
jgi:cytochrome c-type biogenesis protein CcsB